MRLVYALYFQFIFKMWYLTSLIFLFGEDDGGKSSPKMSCIRASFRVSHSFFSRRRRYRRACISLVEVKGKGRGRVSCNFFFSCSECHFAVLMLGIKCLLTISSINPYHVVSWLFLMVLTNVDFTRENSAA